MKMIIKEDMRRLILVDKFTDLRRKKRLRRETSTNH